MISRKSPKAIKNSPIDKSFDSLGSAVLMRAEKCSPVAILSSHSGEGRMREIRFMSFPCRIFVLRRCETFAPAGMYGLPGEGVGMAEAKEN